MAEAAAAASTSAASAYRWSSSSVLPYSLRTDHESAATDRSSSDAISRPPPPRCHCQPGRRPRREGGRQLGRAGCPAAARAPPASALFRPWWGSGGGGEGRSRRGLHGHGGDCEGRRHKRERERGGAGAFGPRTRGRVSNLGQVCGGEWVK